jgi:hypothetical protein
MGKHSGVFPATNLLALDPPSLLPTTTPYAGRRFITRLAPASAARAAPLPPPPPSRLARSSPARGSRFTRRRAMPSRAESRRSARSARLLALALGGALALGSASPATAASSNASCLADGSCGGDAAFPDGTPPSRDRPPTARREKTDPTPARPDPDAPAAHPPPASFVRFSPFGTETCENHVAIRDVHAFVRSSSAAPSDPDPLLPPSPSRRSTSRLRARVRFPLPPPRRTPSA